MTNIDKAPTDSSTVLATEDGAFLITHDGQPIAAETDDQAVQPAVPGCVGQ